MKKTKNITFFISLFLIFFVFLFCRQECFAASTVGTYKDTIDSSKTPAQKVIYTLYSDGTAMVTGFEGWYDPDIEPPWNKYDVKTITLKKEVKDKKGNTYKFKGIKDYALFGRGDGGALGIETLNIPFVNDLTIEGFSISRRCTNVRFYNPSNNKYYSNTEFIDEVINRLCNDPLKKYSDMSLQTGWWVYLNWSQKDDPQYFFTNCFTKISEKYYQKVWENIEIFPPANSSYTAYKDLLKKENCNTMDNYLKKIVGSNEYDSKHWYTGNKGIYKTSWWTNESRTSAETEIDYFINDTNKNKYDFLFVVDATTSMFYDTKSGDKLSKDMIAYGQTIQLVNKLIKGTDNRAAVVTFSNALDDNNNFGLSKTTLTNGLKAKGRNSADSGFFSLPDDKSYNKFVQNFREYYPQNIDAGTDYYNIMSQVYDQYFKNRKDTTRTPFIVFISDGKPQPAEDAYESQFNAKLNSESELAKIGDSLRNKNVIVKGILIQDMEAKKYMDALTTNGKRDVFSGKSEEDIVNAFKDLAYSVEGYINLSDKVNTNIFNIESVTYQTVDGKYSGTIKPDGNLVKLSLPKSAINQKTVKVNIDLSLKDYTYCSSSIKTNSGDAVVSGFSDDFSVSSPVLKRYGLKILKTDTDEIPLKDAVFSLKDSNDNLIRLEPVDEHEGDYLYCGVRTGFNKATTNSDGCINIYGLSAEPYKIYEKSAPAEFIIAQPTTDVTANAFSPENPIPEFRIKNDIASYSMYVEKSFKIGTLGEDEVKKFVEDITIEINGTKINGKTSKLNYKLSSFPYVISGTGSERYVRFYKYLNLKSGSYTVTEVLGPISSSCFDKNNIKSLSNTSYFLDIVNANNSDTVRCDLSSIKPKQYVFFVNNCKTGEITIEKTASVDASWDKDKDKEKFASVLYDTSFNISGKTLIGEDYNKTITIDESNIDSWEFVKNDDKLCLRYTLTGVPYSGSSGYVVKEIPNAKTDSSKTLTYSSFLKMGREDGVLSSNKTLKINSAYQEGSV